MFYFTIITSLIVSFLLFLFIIDTLCITLFNLESEIEYAIRYIAGNKKSLKIKIVILTLKYLRVLSKCPKYIKRSSFLYGKNIAIFDVDLYFGFLC